MLLKEKLTAAIRLSKGKMFTEPPALTRKKAVAPALLLLAIMLVAVQGTSAYFTASTAAHNVITSGAIDITLVETTLDANQNEVPYPADPVVGVMPGTEHSKIVRVRNSGEHSAWIRIRVETSIRDAQGNSLPTDKLGIHYDESFWVEEDGFFYYKTKVAPGAKTEPLFRTVQFDPTMGNAYQNATVQIDVIAQGVQSANNDIPKNADVTDVKGWPAIAISQEGGDL